MYSDQFVVQTFANIFLYFDILTISPMLNLEILLLISILESIYVFDVTSFYSRFYFNYAICVSVIINYIIQFINIRIFETELIYL